MHKRQVGRVARVGDVAVGLHRVAPARRAPLVGHGAASAPCAARARRRQLRRGPPRARPGQVGQAAVALVRRADHAVHVGPAPRPAPAAAPSRPPHCRRSACAWISGRPGRGRRSAKRARSCISAASVLQLVRATGDGHSISIALGHGAALCELAAAVRDSKRLGKDAGRVALAARGRVAGRSRHVPCFNRRRSGRLREPGTAGPRRRAGCRRT